MKKISLSIKQKFKSLSINSKFTYVVTVISVIILLVNIFLFGNINYMINEIDDIYDSNIRLNNLMENLNQVRESVTGYLNTKSSESMEDYYRYCQNLRDKLEDLNDIPISDKLKMSEKNIRNLSYSYLDCTDEAIEAKRGRNIEKYKYYYDSSEEVYKYVSDYISNLNNERFKENAGHYLRMSQSLKFMEVLCFLIFGIISVIGVIVVTIICNNITNPLKSLATAAGQVSSGNYDVELSRNVSDDEVGVVTLAFLNMIQSIRESIVKLRENMEKEREMKEKELMMEAHLKDAQLKYLQAQINPHFLFNTLNAGAQLAMMEGADRTYDYVQQVATFFRYNIKKDNDIVSLRDEVSMVDTYIYILNVRFSGEIGYEKEVDEDLLDIKLPGMCLQPIVENCVNYGIRDIGWKGVINLSVLRDRDRVCVSIKDNGIGMSPERIEEVLDRRLKESNENSDSNGIGLANVMTRLELLYGSTEVIDIFSEGKNKGTEVRLYLPFDEN